MKHLVKGVEPGELSRARADIRRTPDHGDEWYEQLDSTVRDIVRQQCLREQGYLCAYTGLRVEMDTSHLEHMYPQSECSKEEQIDYSNLVACYNGPNDPHPGFGARQKDHWPNREQRPLLVRPIDADCEECFLYEKDGTIRSAHGTARETETIIQMRLSDNSLVGYRRVALKPLLKIARVDVIKNRIAGLKQTYDERYEEYAFPKQQFLEARLAKLQPKVKAIIRNKQAKKRKQG